jgi:hypothetical protein
MAKQQPPLSLLGVMILPVWNRMVEMNPHGGRYVQFGRLLSSATYLYESGAIIGCSKRDRLEILAHMIVLPGKETQFVADSQSQAKKRLHELGRDPTSIFDLVWSTELAKVGLTLPDFPDFKRKSKPFYEKLPCDPHLEARLKMFILEGVGFGSLYPGLAEKMWRHSHEAIDKGQWSQLRTLGLEIAEDPSPVTFEQETERVQDILAAYASEYYPELMGPLGLHPPGDDRGQRTQTGTTTRDAAVTYCPRCGLKSDSQANYCRGCGTSLR